MIKITYNQLLVAASEGSISGFLRLRKPISVSVLNRKTSQSIDAELALFYKLRDDLLNSVGGDTKALEQSKGWSELLSIEIELPGEPIAIKHLLPDPNDKTDERAINKLSERDLLLLEPFIKFED